MTRTEKRRLAILAEATALCVPAFLTPMWQRYYGKAVAA